MRQISRIVGPAWLLITALSLLLSGCEQSGSSWSGVTSNVSIQGSVSTGDQAISGSEIQLYVTGTEGIGSSAQTLLAAPVHTDSDGRFAISDAVTCPSANAKIYVAAKGGSTGLEANANNGAIMLLSMLGTCSDLDTATVVTINELTTVGSVAPMSRYMASISEIGASLSDPAFPEAVTRVSQLVNVNHGVSPGTGIPDGYMVQTDKLNSLANVLSACVRSAGGVAGDGSICGSLFTLATPSGGDAPTNTAMAALRIAQDPAVNVGQLYALMQPATSPFQPSLNVAPSDWDVALVAATSKSLFISVTNVGVGASKTGTVSLATPALANLTVSLASKNTAYVSVSPAAFTIAKGATSGTFTYAGRAVGITALTASASGYTSYTRGLAATPATPVFSLAAGTYASGSSIRVGSTAGVVIHYTVNGATPTSNSAVYSVPIVLTSALTLKAVAVAGGQASDVAAASYAVTTNSDSTSSPGYYVSNWGNDSSAGTSAAAPWKTLAKANAAKLAPGSSLYLQCGSIFREVMTVYYTGTAARPLNYTSYGSCTGSNRPVISGADLLSTWKAEGDGLFTSYYSSEPTRPTVVFENNHRLPLVEAKLSLTKGTSFYDAVNKRVYVRTLEDASPVGHTIEANVRSYAVAVTDRSHFRITGLEMDKASQTAAVFSGTMTDVKLLNTVTNYSKASGIWFSANAGESQSDILIQGCTASYNGQNGVMKGNGGSNFIIDSCVANYDAFDPAYVFSGALHIVSDGLYLSNRVTNSGIQSSMAGWAGVNPDTGVKVPNATQSGVGIWCDTCGAGSFLLHNVAHDSVQAGVQMEFSGTVGSRTVGYNISYHNNFGILHIRRSHNDLITNNTAWDNLENCEFSGEYGGGEVVIGMVANIYQNNICASQVLNSNGVGFIAQYGAENNSRGEGSKNIYRNNSFGVPSASNGTFADYGAGQKKTTYPELNTAYKSNMNSVTADPLLTSPATGDFRLKAGSPAIGAGFGGVDLGAIPYTP